MAVTYTNRKGVTYYLHRRERRGKARYVFCRDLGDGPVDEIPDGYEVKETPNGLVSVAKSKPRAITPREEAAVRRYLPPRCKLEVKGRELVVHEPLGDGGTGIEHASPWLRAAIVRQLERRERYEPVMRLTLTDENARWFEVTRRYYSGHGGWTYPLGGGSIDEVAREFVTKVGTQDYFELM